MLSAADVARLEAGLPDLARWGEALLQPFVVRRLRRASVLWLNARWLLERGFDVSDHAERVRIEAWLLQEFAFAVPLPTDPADAYADESTIVHADRYGASGRTPHGGSGRVATRRRFQVKGAGATPLVGRRADWFHAHGCLWLEEALREAIFGEIADAEFPHGAVPAIAILDTGLNYRDEHGVVGERRALLVRPAVLRVAHLERAPLFVPAGDARAAQIADAARTRQAVRCYLSGAGATHGVCAVETLIDRVAEQIAFGQVQRLFYGYFSSNLSLGGALLDYGAMRSLPDWAGALVNDESALFGRELVSVHELVKSLGFYLRKYGEGAAPGAAQLLDRAEKRRATAFDAHCARLWNLAPDEPGAAEVAAIVRGYFARQQRIRVVYNEPFYPLRPWLFDALGPETAGMDDEVRTHDAIDAALIQAFGSGPPAALRRAHAWAAAARLLMPRELINRERLQGLLFDTVVFHRSEAPPDRRRITYAIEAIVAGSRRDFAALPPMLCVRAQSLHGASTALWCSLPGLPAPLLWCAGVRRGEAVRLFDTWVEAAALPPAAPGGYWRGVLPLAAGGPADGGEARVGAVRVPVPPAALIYPLPARALPPARLIPAVETMHASA